MAMPGSEYCASCNPGGININQGQTGSGAQQQAQNINASGIQMSQHQSQVSGGAQQQGFSVGSKQSNKTINKKLSKIDKRLKDVQEDVKLVKKYTSQIEQIFDKLETLDDLETFLRNKLSSDFEKIKVSWQDYKSGKITKKELIIRSLKVIGKKFVKKILFK